MAEYQHLRHFVTEGATEQLFEPRAYIVRALTAGLQSLNDVKMLSGPEMAKIVLNWAKKSSEG